MVEFHTESHRSGVDFDGIGSDDYGFMGKMLHYYLSRNRAILSQSARCFTLCRMFHKSGDEVRDLLFIEDGFVVSYAMFLSTSHTAYLNCLFNKAFILSF